MIFVDWLIDVYVRKLKGFCLSLQLLYFANAMRSLKQKLRLSEKSLFTSFGINLFSRQADSCHLAVSGKCSLVNWANWPFKMWVCKKHFWPTHSLSWSNSPRFNSAWIKDEDKGGEKAEHISSFFNSTHTTPTHTSSHEQSLYLCMHPWIHV